MSIKVLVVDDEKNLVKTIRAYFEHEGYEVNSAYEGTEALAVANSFDPDVVILDIMLPGMDGLEVLRELRANSDPFVILLTAKTEENDRILGLKMGADDYVIKPFSPRELVARVQAVLRRQRKSTRPHDQKLHGAGITIDPAARKVWYHHKELELTRIEFDILLTLMENAGRVLSRDQLVERVWGDEYFIEERVVDVHIRRLRKKLLVVQSLDI